MNGGLAWQRDQQARRCSAVEPALLLSEGRWLRCFATPTMRACKRSWRFGRACAWRSARTGGPWPTSCSCRPAAAWSSCSPSTPSRARRRRSLRLVVRLCAFQLRGKRGCFRTLLLACDHHDHSRDSSSATCQRPGTCTVSRADPLACGGAPGTIYYLHAALVGHAYHFVHAEAVGGELFVDPAMVVAALQQQLGVG